MKRISIMLLCLMMIVIVHAQTEHMKFMGIPLNGTISQFQSKLQAKGIKHDVEGSRNIGKGVRMFHGTFSGKDCDIFVYYNENTKIVYRAKASIERTREVDIVQLYSDFKASLSEKYSDNKIIKEYYDLSPQLIIYLDDKNNKSLGEISLYITQYEHYSTKYYFLNVDYVDCKNEEANKKRNLDDL